MMPLSSKYGLLLAAVVCFYVGTLPVPLHGQKPTVEYALQLTPIQRDVEYDRPMGREVQDCTIEAEAAPGVTSWVVRSGSGLILRRFDDTNGDNKVDRWCYYRGGVEVYRDIDSDYNQKADQYRWLGTAGTRWGIDHDEDGRIDSWKVISAEEVTAEVVAALRDRDAARFRRLLITEEELGRLGVSTARAEEIRRKVAQAARDFELLCRQQTQVKPDSQWVFFGGGMPAVIAAGTDGATSDVYLYDHASAVVETDGKSAHVSIGPLVRVGDVWRMIDLPAILVEGEAVATFFPASLAGRDALPVAPSGGTVANLQNLVNELDAVDKQLADATGPALAALHAKRATLLEQIAAQCDKPEDRNLWYRQLADTVSVAVQSGAYPDGVERLAALVSRLEKENAPDDVVAFATFRWLMADYTQQLQAEGADFAKIHTTWVEKLEALVERYPRSVEVADAMLQIAMAHEFAGEEDKAIQWYSRLVSSFPKADAAEKAAGARKRLQSEGKPFTLRGTTTDGRPFDLASHRGRVVVVYYWASWCEPCKQELNTLQSLATKYGRNGLTVVGINLDTDQQAFLATQRASRFPGILLREPGGLDGPLANDMGILTLPTVFVVDRQGRMADRNARVADLESTLQPLLKQ
jgi:thiol-disulfide isomerase/thioredoxin